MSGHLSQRHLRSPSQWSLAWLSAQRHPAPLHQPQPSPAVLSSQQHYLQPVSVCSAADSGRGLSQLYHFTICCRSKVLCQHWRERMSAGMSCTVAPLMSFLDLDSHLQLLYDSQDTSGGTCALILMWLMTRGFRMVAKSHLTGLLSPILLTQACNSY